MILTTCAACAAPLAHNAPRCVRCKLRYCNQTCQHRADGVFSRDDLAEAVTIFEDLARVMRRVYGAKHPHTGRMLRNLAKARRKHTLLVNLRFAVGDRVKCQCGEWVPGRVVRLLYDGPEIENPGWDYAPYQVKLDDGRLVYAPSDDDETIREFNSNPYSK